MNAVTKRSQAFDGLRLRREMWNGVLAPDQILQIALDKLNEKLTAKKVEYYTFQGVVTDQREVEDHQTQLSAIDKVLRVADAYAKEEAKSRTPSIKVVMKDGVLEMIVGDEPSQEGGDDDQQVRKLNSRPPQGMVRVGPEVSSQMSLLDSNGVIDVTVCEEPSVQFVKRRKGEALLPEARKILFGD